MFEILVLGLVEEILHVCFESPSLCQQFLCVLLFSFIQLTHRFLPSFIDSQMARIAEFN